MLILALLARPDAAAAYDSVDFPDPVPLKDAVKLVAIAGSADRLYALDEKQGLLFLLDEESRAVKSVAGSGSQQFVSPKGLALNLHYKLLPR